MNTATTKFPERAIRHIARKQFNLTFADEHALHQRNEGKITWLPAGFAILINLALGIFVYAMWETSQRATAIVFAVGFGVPLLTIGVMLWKQEFRRDYLWEKICSLVGEFRKTFGRPASADWKKFVEHAKTGLYKSAQVLLRAEIEREECWKRIKYWEDRGCKVEPRERLKIALALLQDRENLSYRTKSVTDTKQIFERDFYLAKKVLGDEVDGGEGFEAFFRHQKEGVLLELRRNNQTVFDILRLYYKVVS